MPSCLYGDQSLQASWDFGKGTLPPDLSYWELMEKPMAS